MFSDSVHISWRESGTVSFDDGQGGGAAEVEMWERNLVGSCGAAVRRAVERPTAQRPKDSVIADLTA